MKPFVYNGEVLGEQKRLFVEPRCNLSLLGLAGGSGGLGSSGVGPSNTTAGGTNTITVNNGGAMSTTTWLIIAGIGLAALLILGVIHGRK